MSKFKGIKVVFVVLVMAGLLIGYYYHLSNKATTGESVETVETATAVAAVLERNLSNNYPATPKEVVKYFSEITQCYYNETYSKEELIALADKMLLIYDDELVSYKSYEDYILDLKSDIAFYNQNGWTVSSYSPSASTDVFFFSEDGFDWARLYCIYTLKAGKQYKNITEVFVLRKDENSHWKIYGWDLVNE